MKESTEDEVREALRKKFESILCLGTSEELEIADGKREYECAWQLEDALYRMFKFGKQYSDKARFLLFNL